MQLKDPFDFEGRADASCRRRTSIVVSAVLLLPKRRYR